RAGRVAASIWVGGRAHRGTPAGPRQTCPVLASSVAAPAPRLRAAAPPRSGFFFKRDLVALKEAPHRGATTRKLALAHRTDHLVQRQIRLPLNQRQQKGRVLLQW